MRAIPDDSVCRSRVRGPKAPLVARGSERLVFVDTRLEGGDVLGVDRRQIEFLETPRRLAGRSGPGQSQHGPVTQLDVTGILLKAAPGKIERQQQLAASFSVAHRPEPRVGGARRFFAPPPVLG